MQKKKKSTHPRKKSTKSTPAKQKKSKPQKKSTKKHFGAFKSTHYDPCLKSNQGAQMQVKMLNPGTNIMIHCLCLCTWQLLMKKFALNT